ncbi:MAG: hypothetical protein NTY53_18665 [Kiritimatiellaeota bacterium]|nr:hypothetical protein [Kiritimatiellota bacterium]
MQARAEQGNANAQFVLGLRYYNGDGVTKSFVEADKWFLIAKASAHELASAASKEVAKKMKPAQVAEAEARAKQWQDAFKLSHSAKE